jgi:hypothetical protein
MRKIKFRGKGINGEWYKGLLSISQGKPDQPEKGYYISNEAGMPWAYQVRPKTIGQLIATIDGQEFYEGDIGRIKTIVNKDYYENLELVFETDEFLFQLNNETFLLAEKAEIIGNKYDNPELIENA